MSPDTPFALSGKHALVTGGSRGIGLGIAHAMIKAGATVTILGRDQSSLDKACEALGERARGVCGDAAETTKISELFSTVVSDFGEVDILVNNAGMTYRGPAENLPLSNFEAVMQLNVTAAFAFAQAFALNRIDRKKGGKIINIASLMSEVSRRNTAAYTASKGAIKMLTKNMACEWAQFGVQTNAIGPGFIQTDFTQALWSDPEFDAWVKKRTPQARWGRPEDIGRVAVFLASAAADFVNGQIIYVDGGLLASL